MSKLLSVSPSVNKIVPLSAETNITSQSYTILIFIDIYKYLIDGKINSKSAILSFRIAPVGPAGCQAKKTLLKSGCSV